MKFYVYDLETFLNCFLFLGSSLESDDVDVFEMSSRKNQREDLLTFLNYHRNAGTYFIGFRNLGFDYPIIHDLLNRPYAFTFRDAYQLGQSIITTSEENQPRIRIQDRAIPQIDLAKIHHFDNKARMTRLKDLEIAMRSEHVDDLPYSPHESLNSEQMDRLIRYGINDVRETKKFAKISLPLIEMRKELLDHGDLTGDVYNYSDVKIGVEYLVKKIGRPKCFTGGKPKQTFRDAIPFKDIILPKIYFYNDEFREVLDWFKATTFYVHGETRPSLSKTLAGLPFEFGIGGCHASAKSKIFESDEEYVIKDIDVAGMYPAIAVVNGFSPEHLGKDFSINYAQLGIDRKKYPKGSSKNKMLKLSNNGVYGKSSDVYSCFYDPKYTYSVTVNGQLQILQLAERLSMIPGTILIQANTDGITLKLRRSMENLFHFWTKDWERETGLELEEVEYRKMVIRDVNNYIAVTTKGKVKRKGTYWFPENLDDYEGNWHKDFSAMIVPKAISLFYVNGIPITQTLSMSTDPFDFMIREKVNSSSRLELGGRAMPRTLRYYVSSSGEKLFKRSPPNGPVGEYKRKNGISNAFYSKILSEIGTGVWDERIHTKNKSIYEERINAVQAGWLIKECNVASQFNWKDINVEYYKEEIEKLFVGEV